MIARQRNDERLGISGALYPHYPEAFDNPVFDLAFPLIGQGYAPYGLGWLLHLPGSWSLAPLAVVVLAALSLVAAGDDPRPRRTAASPEMSTRPGVVASSRPRESAIASSALGAAVTRSALSPPNAGPIASRSPSMATTRLQVVMRVL